MTDPETLHLVDDDAALREALAQRLRLAGYSVRHYAGPVDFLKGVDLYAPGCAILDLNMPGMTGLELLQVMVDRRATLPVIIQSGYCDRRSRSRALALGAVAVLDKPVPSARLLQVVAGALAFDRAARHG
jgi:two-component system response regulator FixJ